MIWCCVGRSMYIVVSKVSRANPWNTSKLYVLQLLILGWLCCTCDAVLTAMVYRWDGMLPPVNPTCLKVLETCQLYILLSFLNVFKFNTAGVVK